MLDNTMQAQLTDFVRRAFEEDVRDGDHTSLACVPKDAIGRARLIVKDDGILAGVAFAKFVFAYLDPNFELDVLIEDGSPIKKGDIAFTVRGRSQLILQAERLVLNAMQRMSGIATLTRQYVDAVADFAVQLLDTRKTTPTIRFLEKWAVRIGGGTNYREGLYDRIMIKDNHTDFCGDIATAIQKVHNYLATNNLNLDITVEVRNLKELEDVLAVGGIQRIMLDNFDVPTMIKAVARINKSYEVEASGGITMLTLREIAATGVDFISVGALTHSFQSLDLSLKEYEV
jgi:nicotinate-nucleotide pyrophosphorylase (carboxylating)